MTQKLIRRCLLALQHPLLAFWHILGKDRSLHLLRIVASLSRTVARRAHYALFKIQWGIAPEPEWHDQLTTHYALWEMTGQPFLAERGAMALPAIPLGATVLELCCGDGYYTRYFHAARANSVVAMDFDPAAIAFASKYHRRQNVNYRVGDIRVDLPVGQFDTIIWNGAIEHFTSEEIANLVPALISRLKPGGILTGYTIAEVAPNIKQLSHHEYEFKSKEDLLRFFTPYFKRAKVIESYWPAVPQPAGVVRHNLYFYASDGTLPFDQDWPHSAEKHPL